ncbi:MAG: nucleotidyltransferase family protein [Ferrovibrio sp.]|uniref:nucleotidyltransferase family protein n=1 Tax=Ferrovibrio sp. TaxID=1917215 RepID=UPI0039194C5B
MLPPDHQTVIDIIAADPWAMDILWLVRSLRLPDWAIGAGFVRGLVWDRLCGFTQRTPLNDIDVVYFDPADTGRDAERAAEAELAAARILEAWSVRNMARMHLKNGDEPYRNTTDAIGHWLETPTAVAITMEDDGALRLLAPHGVADLLAGRVRPTPSGQRKPAEYRARVTAKAWPSRWPKVVVEGLT